VPRSSEVPRSRATSFRSRAEPPVATAGAGALPFFLAAAGGVLLALSGEPWSYNPAGFASLLLLLEALAHAGEREHRVLRSTLIGLTFGTVVNGIALFSVGSLLQAFGGFSPWSAWPVAVLAFAAQGLPYAIVGTLTELCVGRGLARWFAFPACLVIAMWVSPQLFPWRPSAPQVDFLWFVQIADLGGEALLDLCMATCASAAWHAMRAADASPRARMALSALALAAVLLPCAYGKLRLVQVRRIRDAAPAVRLGVVQSNVGITLKHDPLRSAEVLADLRSLTAALERQGSELTVWPETAYPYALLRSRRGQPEDERVIVRSEDPATEPKAIPLVRGPVLLGAVTYRERGEVQTKYNSAWLLREDGHFGDRVDKSRLLAFGEYVPFWDWLPPLRARYPSRGFEAGENDIIRAIARGADGRAREIRYGILICYEDLFGDLARKVVERGAQVLVNMTNDAWFGDSHEPALHDMVARMRAVETRRDLVRVVNTGVSSFTWATGETVKSTATFTRQTFLAEVKPLSELTIYSAWGNWLPPLLSLLVLAALFRLNFRRSP
jgi:apolipoprotein N-acyltransferase